MSEIDSCKKKKSQIQNLRAIDDITFSFFAKHYGIVWWLLQENPHKRNTTKMHCNCPKYNPKVFPLYEMNS